MGLGQENLRPRLAVTMGVIAMLQVLASALTWLRSVVERRRRNVTVHINTLNIWLQK